MNNKAYLFYSASCLMVGLAIGYLAARVKDGNAAANAYQSFKFIDLAESQERAFEAYQRESPAVAIYSMNEALDKLEDAKRFGLSPFMNQRMIAFDLMLTHARLTRLYTETDQTNRSAQNLAEALGYAKTDSNLAITNESTLMDFVAKIGRNVK